MEWFNFEKEKPVKKNKDYLVAISWHPEVMVYNIATWSGKYFKNWSSYDDCEMKVTDVKYWCEITKPQATTNEEEETVGDIFDTLNVGDTLTNKTYDESLGRELGYDYIIIDKTQDKIDVQEMDIGNIYSISKDDINCGFCMDLRKKENEEK